MEAAHAQQIQPKRSPALMFVEGTQRRNLAVRSIPFTIGRRVDKDLVLTDSRCSRDHAQIVLESEGYFLVDQGSKLGTFVNGLRVDRHRLRTNDKIEFGVRGGAYLVFDPDMTEVAPTDTKELLSRMSGFMAPSAGAEFATLNLLLEAARKLSSSAVLEDVLRTLVDTSLRLTRAERGYVFLKDAQGNFKMAAGRDSRGNVLVEDHTVSHSSLEEAAASGSEFVVTDDAESDKLAGRMSVANFGLASVICIPLRRVAMETTPARKPGRAPKACDEVRGVLYLDSRSLSGRLSAVSHDVLRTIATEAAALVENASLVQTRESARRYEQELSIAATIQQRLLSVRIPKFDFAEVQARSIPCLHVGGDFFEVVRPPRDNDTVAFAVADVSGKGVSAALLGSVLQGLVHSHLAHGTDLRELAVTLHAFVCDREIDEKYATLLLGKVNRDGEFQWVNCGHLPPLLISDGRVAELPGNSMPVGLVRDAAFETRTARMKPGDRLIVITDGVTEAQNAGEDFFGQERLEKAAAGGLNALFDQVQEFCAGVAMQDDCTGMEVTYRG